MKLGHENQEKEIQYQESKVNQQKQKKFINSFKLKNGHSLFKYSFIDNTIEKVELNKKAILKKNGVQVRSELIREDGFGYFPALNYKNAKRKVEKLGFKVKEKDESSTSTSNQ